MKKKLNILLNFLTNFIILFNQPTKTTNCILLLIMSRLELFSILIFIINILSVDIFHTCSGDVGAAAPYSSPYIRKYFLHLHDFHFFSLLHNQISESTLGTLY